ncbi:unnamed protein product [Caenorhabditis bovis]|uniref:C2H2-type domain-containing protein n=1 Tax=Caenorhabditis bovis TaxID=2654633 RepID=A0A8S1EH65_9PELO|nr:unnamed protein product [Caenorhabditis bovis]
MPYRAELKRPDLKGSFPCSVCGKIFCHSSSLSRHRMQAHFKSYTCTQCNQEISSNDTLRSHMFRYHNITRMFMCRCCNWAFPDKTSLHIHMQSMLRNGTPGEVAVLARSSTEDGHIGSPESPSRSPAVSTDGLFKNVKNTNNNTAINNKNLASIFPNLLKSQESVTANKPMFPLDLSSLGANNFLTAWLANNPLGANFNMQNVMKKDAQENSSDYDELEVHTTEEDLKDEETINSETSPRSVIVKAEPIEKTSVKRKLSFDDNEDIDVEGDEGAPRLKMSIEEHLLQEQPSPTVSDSHVSGSSIHSGETKCFDCQVAKGKLSASEEKCRSYEKQIRELQCQLQMLRKLSLSPESVPRPIIPPALFPNPMLPMGPATPSNLLQNPAMRMLINNFVQSQMNRQMC